MIKYVSKIVELPYYIDLLFSYNPCCPYKTPAYPHLTMRCKQPSLPYYYLPMPYKLSPPTNHSPTNSFVLTPL